MMMILHINSSYSGSTRSTTPWSLCLYLAVRIHGQPAAIWKCRVWDWVFCVGLSCLCGCLGASNWRSAGVGKRATQRGGPACCISRQNWSCGWPRAFQSCSRILSLLGYRLEVPCVYHMYAPKAYVERAKAMLSGDLSQMWSSGESAMSQNWSSILTVQVYHCSVLMCLVSCINFCPLYRTAGCMSAFQGLNYICACTKRGVH